MRNPIDQEFIDASRDVWNAAMIHVLDGHDLVRSKRMGSALKALELMELAEKDAAEHLAPTVVSPPEEAL